MRLIQRAIRICTQPAEEWKVIEGEQTSPAQVIFGYVLPLALIGVLAALIRTALFTPPLLDPSLDIGRATLVRWAAFAVIGTLGSCAITAVVINGLARTFEGVPNMRQAFKLTGYSWTPVLLFNLLTGVPLLQNLAILGALYAVYLLYRGLPILMQLPEDRSVPYTFVAALAAIMAVMLLSMLIGMALLVGSFFTDNPFRIV